MFTYQTGKYANSVNDYFLARSSDKKSEFQFDVTDRGLKFRRVAFSNAPVP